MIEGGRWQAVHLMPGGGGIGPGGERQLVGGDQGEVDHADDPAARVAVGLTKGEQLLQVNLGRAGRFGQHAQRGFFQSFIQPDEPAGQSPGVLEGRLVTPDEQHL